VSKSSPELKEFMTQSFYNKELNNVESNLTQFEIILVHLNLELSLMEDVGLDYKEL
jgi:hypothetical protein